MAILSLGNNNSAFSGSFSGSFQGDGSNLTGVGGGTPTFIGSGSTSASADPNNGVVINASGSTLFDVRGSLGSLFSVTDSFEGNLFEVNNISGISLLTVSSSGDVDIPKGKLTVSSSVSASQFLGDGSQLTGISTTPFPFTGDAQITGSLSVSGSSISFKLSGGTVFSIAETGSFTLGEGATATSDNQVAIGKSATAAGTAGVAIGQSANATSNGVSIGNNSNASLVNTVAIGGYSSATGQTATAVGNDADVSGYSAIGIGAYINNSAGRSIVFSATGENAVNHSKASASAFYMTSKTIPDFEFVAGGTSTLVNSNLSGSATSTASFGTYIGDGSGLTGIEAGTNLTQSLFVSPSGNDGTATVGDITKPFQTILAATASANIGDTIIVYPGTYSSETSNIIKDGVNYYFYAGSVVRPTSTLTQNIVEIIDPIYPVNVRGAGTFISDDTEYGAIKIQAKECYFEFDTAKTTNNTTSTNNRGGTVILEPTNGDGNTLGTDAHPAALLGSPFYVQGKIVNTGNLGTYAGALVFGRQSLSPSGSGIFEGSVMQLHPTTARPAIFSSNDDYHYSYKINANAFSSGSEAVLFQGRGEIMLRGSYTTGVKATKYAISIDDGYRQFYDIDAQINGSVKLNTGYVSNSGGILRGRLRTGLASPDDCAIYITSGGQHKIDNQIFCKDHQGYGIRMVGTSAQVDFTGDFNADAGSSYVNFCKVTTGKLMFKGSLGHIANRGTGNVIDGGHLVIDSFFDNNGYNYPNNAYCFVLSAGTLEINNKVTHAFTTTGSGIIDMTGGYLKLNGAELVQLNGTGSFAYGIDLNSGTHSGSILNNSFTNVTPFGPGSFTNEITGGGTLFETDKLY